MKHLVLIVALTLGAAFIPGCQSPEAIQENVAALQQAITAVEAENRTLRDDLQAVADAGGKDSEAAQKIADALERNEKWIEEARSALEIANNALAAADGQAEEFWWELGVGAASVLGFGGLAGALNGARKRNSEAFRAVVTAFEKARKGDSFEFDPATVSDVLADAGIKMKVDAIRKEVKA